MTDRWRSFNVFIMYPMVCGPVSCGFYGSHYALQVLYYCDGIYVTTWLLHFLFFFGNIIIVIIIIIVVIIIIIVVIGYFTT